MDARTRAWVGQCEWLGSGPLLHLQERQQPCQRDEASLVYPHINDPPLPGLGSKRVLLVLALQVVYATDTLLIEHNKSLIACPAKPDYLPLVPL